MPLFQLKGSSTLFSFAETLRAQKLALMKMIKHALVQTVVLTLAVMGILIQFLLTTSISQLLSQIKSTISWQKGRPPYLQER